MAGKHVIVTGGGTGIGAACARLLAAEGARVTVFGRTEARLQEVADGIRAAGGEAHHVVGDVTVEADVARLLTDALAVFGSLHGFVANAGGGGFPSPYHTADYAEFTRVLQLNVLGTMLSVKHAVPALAQTRGSFVGMSSIAGRVTHLWFGAYPVAKAAIEAMMRNAADEYGSLGIRFNSVRPGFTTTEIMELIPRDSDVYRSYLENTPLGGVAEPEDVAMLVRFLLSDESRWITGQEIGVDGGHSLRRGPDFTTFAGPVAAGVLRGEL
jgi:NAD(P)-dependent dehydrogenase (short-subunit alcohol dehydrogenase family)